MHRLLAALVLLVVALAPAPLAAAQIGPNVPEPLTEPPPPPPPAPTNFDDGGLSTLQKVLIFGAAAAVLGTIGFVIVRDARRAAPTDDRRHGSGSGTAKTAGAKPKSAAERKREQRARRAKAKAVRQQRKRNRPR